MPERAIALAPDRVESHYNLGNAWFDVGHYGSAGESFRKAPAVAPDHLDAADIKTLALAGRKG